MWDLSVTSALLRDSIYIHTHTCMHPRVHVNSSRNDTMYMCFALYVKLLCCFGTVAWLHRYTHTHMHASKSTCRFNYKWHNVHVHCMWRFCVASALWCNSIYKYTHIQEHIYIQLCSVYVFIFHCASVLLWCCGVNPSLCIHMHTWAQVESIYEYI